MKVILLSLVTMQAEMVPGTPASSVREVLQDRVSILLLELEGLLDAHVSGRVAFELESRSAQAAEEARVRARRALADQLNRAARHIRQSPDASEIRTRLLDAVVPFASCAILFHIENAMAHCERARGIAPEQAANFADQEVSLESASALAEAVRSRDPVTALAAASELSPMLADLVRSAGVERVTIYPVVSGERVPVLLLTCGEVEGAAVELLAQVAGAQLQLLPQPTELVAISAAQPAGSTWDALSLDEQRLHLRAQRAARVQVAEIRLEDAVAVQRGRARKNLYRTLQTRIDRARADFRKNHFTATPTMVDYLHLELLRTLANDDPNLLGKDYPGPLA